MYSISIFIIVIILIIYVLEKSGKYYEVKRSIIHQYATPYYILRVNAGKFIPAMQFLKAEQNASLKYSGEIVEK